MEPDELLGLRNLGKTSSQWLHATPEQLRQLGPVEAYRAVRARGFNASKALLFAIAGALQDTHWKDLDPAYKQKLLEQLLQSGRRD